MVSCLRCWNIYYNTSICGCEQMQWHRLPMSPGGNRPAATGKPDNAMILSVGPRMLVSCCSVQRGQ